MQLSIITKRIKSALHTNEPQRDMAIMLTALNVIACLSVGAPVIIFVGAILFWPALAFIFNLIDPIP